MFFVVPSMLSASASSTNNETYENGQQKPILYTIPSDCDELGLEPTCYPYSETRESWQYLSSYTQQTINNFQSGDQRGILMVHGIEDIEGNDNFQDWQRAYPNDLKRANGNDYNAVSSPEQLIDHYVDFNLAHRAIIATSLIAFHQNCKYNIAKTFTPAGFILDVPPECIKRTALKDDFSEVVYCPDSKSLQKVQERNKRRAETLFSLDAMVRFPDFLSMIGELWWANMNEVAIASCVKDDDLKAIYRPKIAGVFINKNHAFQTERTKTGDAFAKNIYRGMVEFAKRNDLPVVVIDRSCMARMDIENVNDRAYEWNYPYNKMWTPFEKRKAGMRYLYARNNDWEKERMSRYMLEDQRLEKYGLKRKIDSR